MIYGVGMLELGITFSFDQYVMDNDIIKMCRRIVRGIDINDETLAVDVIKQVGAGGDFIMQEHTFNHMRQEQSQASLMNRKMRYAWKDEGSKDLTTVAHERALYILENHKPTPLAADISENLEAILREAEAKLVTPKK